MDRNRLNYFIDLCMAVAFLIVFVTGIAKLPVFGKTSPSSFISVVHDWSGILLGIFVFLHLVLHWSWIVVTTKMYLGIK